jgi:hypothetical protein
VGPRGTFDLVESRELRVGHVIKVNCDSEFPADLVLLQVCDTFACMWYRVTCDVRNVWMRIMHPANSQFVDRCRRAATLMAAASSKQRICMTSSFLN